VSCVRDDVSIAGDLPFVPAEARGGKIERGEGRPAPFKVGDKVVDRGGYRGSIVQVTEWRGSRWYDVRIMDGCRSLGVAVRYDGDLKHDEAAA
jgi:hypothetical protein